MPQPPALDVLPFEDEPSLDGGTIPANQVGMTKPEGRFRRRVPRVIMGIFLAAFAAVSASGRHVAPPAPVPVAPPQLGRIDVLLDVSQCRSSRMRGVQLLVHEDGFAISQVGLRWRGEPRPPPIELWGHDLFALQGALRTVAKDDAPELELVVDDGLSMDTVIQAIDAALSAHDSWTPRIWLPEYPVQRSSCCGG